MIRNRLQLSKDRIFARKCEVKEISDNKVISKFLDNNHLQGYVGSSIKIGLYFNTKLVSLVTFKKDGDIYNLNRFCNLIDTNIVGGFSKILKYFIKNYSKNIITFSNNDYSNGNLYKNNRFKKEYDLRPDYSYNINGIRKHKFNFRKDRIKKSEDLIFYENMSEYELMLENKIKWKLN